MRLYHLVAMLTPNENIMIMGSILNTNWTLRKFRMEYQVEWLSWPTHMRLGTVTDFGTNLGYSTHSMHTNSRLSQCSWIEIVRDRTTDGWKVDNAMPDEVPERDDKVVGEAQVTLGTDKARVETWPPSPPPLPAKGLHLDQSVTVAWKGLRESIAWKAKYLPLDLRESGL
ncbi:hypothetical protein JB92DRAFT_2891166 [Gautieria morchelliformis]|nr:hypothetical protein JB92DRAFT_2891166 [Gautieria morchelliformis]